MAGFLSRVVPFTYTVDVKLLYCFQRGAVIIQTPNYCSEDFFEWLGAGLTLGGVLRTVFNDLVARHTVLHVYGTPCRQLQRVIEEGSEGWNFPCSAPCRMKSSSQWKPPPIE